MKKRILFIINPISGTKKRQKDQLPHIIENNLDSGRFEYSISYSQFEGHATQIAKEAVENGFDIVVAVGGDGSVNEIGRALVHSDAILAIIPFGSGNGLARNLKLPRNAKKAIRIINKLNIKKIDSGEFAPNEYFFGNVGIGYPANVARRFSHHAVRGFMSYVVAVIKEFSRFKIHHIKMEIDGKVIEREIIMFTVFNANQFGNDIGTAPWAKPDDGWLNVSFLNKIPKWKLVLSIFLALIGLHRFITDLEDYKIKTMKLYAEDQKEWMMQIDGEFERFQGDWNVKVFPSSLNVIVP